MRKLPKVKLIKGLPIIDAYIKMFDESGMGKISIVENPAMLLQGVALSAIKISFDFDGTLSTKKGKEMAKSFIDRGKILYIISARNSAEGIYPIADELGIPHSRVYATGSNKKKEELVKELGIKEHYDNNSDVVNALESVGRLFTNFEFELMDFKFSADKQIIAGYCLIPNLPIYRNGPNGGYYLRFSADTIKQISEKFFSKIKPNVINDNHTNKMVDAFIIGSELVESEQYSKTLFYGIEPILGALFIEVKVNDINYWNNDVKGKGKTSFSIEALLGLTTEKMSEESIYNSYFNSLTNEEWYELLKNINEIL